MNCPTCGVENVAGARFCQGCGVPMERSAPVACPTCGTANPADALFCVSCGSLLVTAEGPSQAQPFNQSTVSLPPKDAGELLSETFRVYGNNFLPLLVIALLPQIPFLVAAVVSWQVSWVFTLIGYLLTFIAAGAVVCAVARQYLGQEVDPIKCIGRAWSRAGPLVLAGILVTLALIVSVVLMVILVGIPLFFYLLVVLFFASPPIVLEGKGTMDALRRSEALVKGSWWRVFGIGVLFVLVIIALSIAAFIPVGIVGIFSTTAADVLGVVAETLVLPFALVGGTLVYLDLRIRKEGYTLHQMEVEVGSQP